MRTFNPLAAVTLIAAVCLLTPTAQALVLNGPGACQSIGGSYSLVMAPPQIGRCTINSNTTLQNGTTLDLISDVALEVVSNATLTNRGNMSLARFAKLTVNPGTLQNYGSIRLDDDAVVHVKTGLLENFGLIHNEGNLNNDLSGGDGQGVRNHGRLDNIDGGTINNAGRFVNENDSMLVNGLDSRIVNSRNAVYVAQSETHVGNLTNERGAVWRLDGGIVNFEGGAEVANFGEMRLTGGGSQVSLQVNAILRNSDRAFFKLFSGAHLNIDGVINIDRATVENHGGSSISIAKGASVLLTKSLLFNSSASMIANSGKLYLDCSTLKNAGTLNGFYISYCDYKLNARRAAINWP